MLIVVFDPKFSRKISARAELVALNELTELYYNPIFDSITYNYSNTNTFREQKSTVKNAGFSAQMSDLYSSSSDNKVLSFMSLVFLQNDKLAYIFHNLFLF